MRVGGVSVIVLVIAILLIDIFITEVPGAIFLVIVVPAIVHPTQAVVPPTSTVI